MGTNAAGTAAIPNGFGIYVESAPNVTIGGTTAEARNVVSGNKETGIYIYSFYASGTTIQGNYVGTDATGVAPVPNSIGILVEYVRRITRR